MPFSSCSASMKTATGTATLKLAMKYSLGLALLSIFILPMQTIGGLKCDKDEYPLGNSKCCRKCPAGEELARRCTASTDSICEPCGHGYYNEDYTESRCKPCKICSKAKGLQEKESCKRTSNRVCTCLPGHYPARGDYNEQICKPCPSGQSLKRGGVECQSWPEVTSVTPQPSSEQGRVVSTTDPTFTRTVSSTHDVKVMDPGVSGALGPESRMLVLIISITAVLLLAVGGLAYFLIWGQSKRRKVEVKARNEVLSRMLQEDGRSSYRIPIQEEQVDSKSTFVQN